MVMRYYAVNVLRTNLKNAFVLICTALLIGFGVASYMGFAFYTNNLAKKIDIYFDSCRLADISAEVKAINSAELESLTNIDGINEVSGRHMLQMRMLTDRSDTPVIMGILGFTSQDKLNRIYINGSSGSEIDESCIYLSEKLEEAYRFDKGETLKLQIEGKTYAFKYGGTVVSPEYIDYLPDAMTMNGNDRLYGIGAIDEGTLEKIAGKPGYYTSLGFELEKGYSYGDVRDALSKRLEGYGLLSMEPRRNQSSYAMFQDEIEQYSSIADGVSALFLLVSMFMIYIIIRKMIDSDRTIIGTMKAMGAKDSELIVTYLGQSTIMAAAGCIIAFIIAYLIADFLYSDEIEYYHMNLGALELYPDIIIKGVLITFATVVAATLLGMKSVLKITPVESMAAAAPAPGKTVKLPKVFEKILNTRQNIALHGAFRNIFRSFAIFYAIAFAISLMAVISSLDDTMNQISSDYYEYSETYDLRVTLTDYVQAKDALNSLQDENILHKEPFADYSMMVSSEKASKNYTVYAPEKNGSLYTVIDNKKHAVSIPSDGIMLSRQAAKELQVGIGDDVELKDAVFCPEGVSIPVTKIVDIPMNCNVYMRLDQVKKYFGRDLGVNNILCTVKNGYKQELEDKLKNAGNVAHVADADIMKADYIESVEQNYVLIRIVAVAALLLGAIMVYSIVNISVRERSKEYGTYMVLGYSGREIFEMIAFEQMILFFIGLLLSVPLVYLLEDFFESLMNVGTILISVKTSPAYYFTAVLLCAGTVLLSLLFVMRNIKKIELTDILKERS